MVCKARNRWRQQYWRVGCWHSLAVCEADICMICVVSQFIEVHGSMKPFTMDDEVKWLAFCGMQWTSEMRRQSLFLPLSLFTSTCACFSSIWCLWGFLIKRISSTFYLILGTINKQWRLEKFYFILTFYSHQVTSKASSFHYIKIYSLNNERSLKTNRLTLCCKSVKVHFDVTEIGDGLVVCAEPFSPICGPVVLCIHRWASSHWQGNHVVIRSSVRTQYTQWKQNRPRYSVFVLISYFLILIFSRIHQLLPLHRKHLIRWFTNIAHFIVVLIINNGSLI